MCRMLLFELLACWFAYGVRFDLYQISLRNYTSVHVVTTVLSFVILFTIIRYIHAFMQRCS